MREQAIIRPLAHQRPLFDRLLAMPLEERLNQPVEMIPFCYRAMAYCYRKQITTLGQLIQLRKKELLASYNLGRKTVEHIEAFLNAAGLGLDKRTSLAKEAPSEWDKAAMAMKKLILDRLEHLKAPDAIRDQIKKLPLPAPEEA